MFVIREIDGLKTPQDITIEIQSCFRTCACAFDRLVMVAILLNSKKKKKKK